MRYLILALFLSGCSSGGGSVDESLVLEDEPEKRLHYVEMQEAHNNGEVWNCRQVVPNINDTDVFRWTGPTNKFAFDINPSAGSYTIWVYTELDGELNRVAATSGTYGVGASSDDPVTAQEFKFFEPPKSRFFEQFSHNMKFPDDKDYLYMDVGFFHYGCGRIEYSLARVEDVLISEIGG